MSMQELRDRVEQVAGKWHGERAERQARRHLERADVDALAEAGFLLGAVPVEQGGYWESMEESTRPLCEVLRVLAAADPSVTLASSMHPAVLGYWLAAPDPSQPAWEEQRTAVFATAAGGLRWGTITSEPGSGGDILRTRTAAVPADDVELALPGRRYRLTGDKHFGSGMGVTDFMLTTGVAEGEDAPAGFALDVRGVPWDGSTGLRLVAEWDGAGMAATQSHAMRFDGLPAVRLAWERELSELSLLAAPLILALFTSVVLGIGDAAVAEARTKLAPGETMRPYEQVEWSRAEMEHWLAEQAYEGMLRAVESGDRYQAMRAGLRAKTACAELLESSVARISRVVGGGTYARRSPFSSWYEDVRALGFLRPPWGLAFDQLFATSFG
jgi:alkylation response protein AidB-like acyl-CoA dehydrogenase